MPKKRHLRDNRPLKTTLYSFNLNTSFSHLHFIFILNALKHFVNILSSCKHKKEPPIRQTAIWKFSQILLRKNANSEKKCVIS